MALTVAGVDPRDVSWESTEPSYRVYFQDSDGATDEWRVDGAADVDEVVAWAQATEAGRSFVLYVEVRDRQGQLGLVRLRGRDVNDEPPTGGSSQQPATPRE